MSASLVGSEMCIRDRLAPFLQLGIGVVVDPEFPEWLAACQHPWHIRLQAVSYTHLTLPTICSV
eukprot:1940696-Alexandrium_andersonii.AAC.1